MSGEQTDFLELKGLVGAMNAADLSVLQATVATPDSQIATVRNSPNDRVWSRLTQLGLAQELPLELEIPPQLKDFQPRSFALTATGREIFQRLLASRA